MAKAPASHRRSDSAPASATPVPPAPRRARRRDPPGSRLPRRRRRAPAPGRELPHGPLPRPTRSPPAARSSPAAYTSESGAQPEQDVDAERGKAAHLRVLLVQEVQDAGRGLERLQPAPATQHPVGPPRVHPSPAAVEDVAKGVELLRA